MSLLYKTYMLMVSNQSTTNPAKNSLAKKANGQKENQAQQDNVEIKEVIDYLVMHGLKIPSKIEKEFKINAQGCLEDDNLITN